MEEKTKRQTKLCSICGKEFKRGEQRLPVSRLGKVHKECYKYMLIEKHGIEVGTFKFEEKIKKEEEKQKNKLKREKEKTEKVGLEEETKKQFFNWIIESYDISLPKHFFIKVSTVVNGTYKGLKEGISFEDLLYMFKSKKNELDKIANNKKIKGQGFENNYNRLCFDLAIIVNKYDSYKKWKEKQKLQSVQAQEMKKTQESLISSVNIIKQQIDNEDIGDILDELF